MRSQLDSMVNGFAAYDYKVGFGGAPRRFAGAHQFRLLYYDLGYSITTKVQAICDARRMRLLASIPR